MWPLQRGRGGKMAEAAELQAVENGIPRTPKDKSCLLGVISRHLEACEVDRSRPVLVLGGEQEDIDILTACGFEKIVLSNLDAAGMALDAENVALADDRYPVVFAHAVLHHCRCPQKAVGEMVRVSQQHVFFDCLLRTAAMVENRVCENHQIAI